MDYNKYFHAVNWRFAVKLKVMIRLTNKQTIFKKQWCCIHLRTRHFSLIGFSNYSQSANRHEISIWTPYDQNGTESLEILVITCYPNYIEPKWLVYCHNARRIEGHGHRLPLYLQSHGDWICQLPLLHYFDTYVFMEVFAYLCLFITACDFS